MSMNGRPDSFLHAHYQIICPLELEYESFEKAFMAQSRHADSSANHRCVIRQLRLNTTDPKIHNAVWSKFEEAANILVQLQHPQIPTFYNYFQEEGYFYLIQEWIEGLSLSQRIREIKPLSSSQVEEILLSLLPVLECLHRNRVIHRSIKPDNIILHQQSNEPILINFGVIEHSLKALINPAEQVSDSNFMRSREFIAPEQRIGRATYSSDLYSLGVTAVYLLTGKLPEEIEKDPQTGQLFWQEHISDVSPHLATVLERAIQFDPNNRYDTADDMLQALQLKPTEKSSTTMRGLLNSESGASASTHTSLSSEITLADQSKVVGLAQPTFAKRRGQSLGFLTAGAAVLLASSVSIAYVGMQRTNPQRAEIILQSEIEGQVLEKEVTPIPSPEELEASASVSLREAQTLQAQGKYPEAIAAAMEVAPTSSMATQSQQLMADLAHIPLNATLDEVLPPQNVEARKIKFLKGTIEDPQKPVFTKFGMSQIDANKVAWESYQTPEGPLQGGQHFIENWDDPWMETYDLVPGKFRLGIIYGCRINAVLQTEAYFHPDVDIGFIKAKLNRMVGGADLSQIEPALEQIYTGELSQHTFEVNGYLGLIQRTDEGEIVIAAREV